MTDKPKDIDGIPVYEHGGPMRDNGLPDHGVDEFTHKSLKDECFGRQELVDLLEDPTVCGDAKRWFAGEVAAEQLRRREGVRPVIEVNPNSEFYDPDRAGRYREH